MRSVKKKSTSSGSSKKSRGSIILQIVLWVIFAAAIVGLIVTIVLQCKSSDNFELPRSCAGPEVSKDQVGNPFARCGSGECQNKTKFPAVNRDAYKLGPLYPVLPNDKNNCNPATSSWLSGAAAEDICNLTVLPKGELTNACKQGNHSKVRALVDTGRFTGKIMRCDRSCPQQVVACGLNDKGIANGVMN